MKKQLIFISLLSAGFILSSCGEKPADSSSTETPASSSKVEESSTDSSEASSSSSSENDIEYATEWSEEDLADMGTYIKTGYVLPFAKGLTTNYVNESGELTDGSLAFVVYDYFSGDLSTSYAKTLTDAGFALDYVGDDDGMPYYNYYYELSDEEALVYVQFYYGYDGYDNGFNIIAWLQEGGKSSEFPYSYIQAYLELDYTLNNTILPSFTLDEGEKYDYYTSGADYCVGGYFDSTITDDDYTSAYETALTNAGYTVDSDNASAINEDASLEVEYMAYYGYFFIQVGKYVPAPDPVVGDHKMTWTADTFPTSYGTDDTITVDSISFKFTSIMQTGGYIQFSKSGKRDAGEIYNTTSMGELKSFVVTINSNSADYYSPLTLNVSSSQISDENVGTKVEGIYDKTALTYTYNVPAGNSYFKLFLEDDTDYASKNDSIVINYTIE